MRISRTLLSAPLLALVSLVSAPVAAAEQTPVKAVAAPSYSEGPAMWVLADEDTTIYMLGTIHILPEQVKWMTKDVNAVIGAADELVVESSTEDINNSMGAMLGMMFGRAEGRDGKMLVDLVSPENVPELRAIGRENGLTMRMLNSMPIWMLPFLFDGMYAEEDEARDEFGVETILEAKFTEDGKPISSIESPLAGFDTLSTLTDEQQVEWFDMMLSDRRAATLAAEAVEGKGDAVAEDGREALAADDGWDEQEQSWARGGPVAFDEYLSDETLGDGVYGALLTKRNTAWVKWIDERLKRPGTILLAVGAGHFYGPDSVLAMLSANGLDAHRLKAADVPTAID